MSTAEALPKGRGVSTAEAGPEGRAVNPAGALPEGRGVNPADPSPPATRAQRGSMSIFTVIFSVVVFLLAGLLVDGGAAINARLRAADVAEQAARAAADEIDVEHLRATGQARLLGEGRPARRPRRSSPPTAAATYGSRSARSAAARPRSP